MKVFAAVLAAAAGLVCAGAVQNDLPFIGVLGSPADVSCDTVFASETQAGVMAGAGGSCFANLYELWLRAAGARVVGIPHDAFDNAKEDLDELLGSLNGVLFTGGGLSLAPSTLYFRTGHYIFEQVQAKNDAGVHFPLHGTCMGFEFLSILAAGNSSVLQPGFDSEALTVPLDFTPAASGSRIFSTAPAEVLDILSTRNVTVNLHRAGVTPETYAANANLSSFFNVLSTNLDRNGRAFVSTVEAKEYPIRGTQWHPERPQFEWNPALNLPHSGDAVTAMAWMAQYFVSEARKNTQSVYSSPRATALAGALTTYNMTAIPMSDDPLEGYNALLFTTP